VRTDGARMVEAYRKVDAALVSKGHPATSGAWLDALTSFWLSGVLRMVVRKGRQVGASTIVCPRVIAATVLGGEFAQSKGSRGTVRLVSHRQKEASERLYNVERTFFDLGIKVSTKDDAIVIPNRPVLVQSFPSSVSAQRGGNDWLDWEDEMPAWRDGDGAANPAEAIDAAIVPAGAMHPNRRIYSVGTPQGHLDFHAQLVAQGDTPSQRAYSGPSWHWNPTLTEERCRELQPRPIVFDREFGAIPSDEGIAVYPIELIDAAMARTEPECPAFEHETVLAIDASRGGDAWTYCFARYVLPDKLEAIRKLSLVHPRVTRRWTDQGQVVESYEVQTERGEWVPVDAELARVKPLLVILEIGTVPDAADAEGAAQYLGRRARGMGDWGRPVRRCFADQYEAGALSVLLRREGLDFREMTWTNTTKREATDRIEFHLRERTIVLPNHPVLRRQLSEWSERTSKTGLIVYSGRGRHDDFAQCLHTLAMGEVDQQIPGSPYRASRERHEVFERRF